MTSRSSIFNSDFRWARALDLRAIAVVLSILCALELGVSRSDWLWRRAPNTMVGAFFGVEREVLAHAPPPAVVFVGSSRMRDAVAPRALEAALGLQRGGVLNLGMTGGTPYEALLFYERHRPLLRHARVMVVGIEDWYWNEGVPRDEVERYFATFGDRWHWFHERHELGDLVGGAWRTLELQDPLSRFAMSFVRGVKPVVYRDDRVVWRPSAEVREVGPATVDVDGAIAHNTESYEPGPAYERSLGRLLSLAHDDGVALWIVQLPQRTAYVETMQRRYPHMQPYVQRRVDALARAVGGQVSLFGAGTELGIPDDRFYDYGHLTEDGCRRMRGVWAARLGPSLRPPSPNASPSRAPQGGGS